MSLDKAKRVLSTQAVPLPTSLGAGSVPATGGRLGTTLRRPGRTIVSVGNETVKHHTLSPTPSTGDSWTYSSDHETTQERSCEAGAGRRVNRRTCHPRLPGTFMTQYLPNRSFDGVRPSRYMGQWEIKPCQGECHSRGWWVT